MAASMYEEVSQWQGRLSVHCANLMDHESDFRSTVINTEHLAFQDTTDPPYTFDQSWIISCYKEMAFQV